MQVKSRLKTIVCATLLCLITFLFPLTAGALTVQDIPNPRQVNSGWVTDTADILDRKTESELNKMIAQLEAKNGAEIAVVTVPTTKPAPSPKQFTTELFNRWGIGKRGEDNGLLFLISVAERRVEIETGYGIEGILPDARVGNIIDQKITPEFKKGDYNQGTLAGTRALIMVLNGEGFTSPAKFYGWEVGILAGGSIFLLLLLIAGQIRHRYNRRALIEPEGLSESPTNLSTRGGTVYYYIGSQTNPLHCNQCQKPLQKVDSQTLERYLSQPQQVARQLGSREFEGWECLKCRRENSHLGIHIFAKRLYSNNCHEKCPNCQEFTVTATSQQITAPTPKRKGKKRITEICHCCDYRHERIEAIAPLSPPTSKSPSASLFSNRRSTSSSSSSYSDYSGGSSFGGGESGGGGAGGDW